MSGETSTSSAAYLRSGWHHYAICFYRGNVFYYRDGVLINSEKMPNVTDISSSTTFNNFYVFDINNGEGFVVISGDDNTEPILAYSLTDAFPTTEMPKHILLWYEGYEAEVEQNSKGAKSPVVKEASASTTQRSSFLRYLKHNGTKTLITTSCAPTTAMPAATRLLDVLPLPQHK